eukprot:9494939-Pyramimonas_sp.AAC.2
MHKAPDGTNAIPGPNQTRRPHSSCSQSCGPVASFSQCACLIHIGLLVKLCIIISALFAWGCREVELQGPSSGCSSSIALSRGAGGVRGGRELVAAGVGRGK